MIQKLLFLLLSLASLPLSAAEPIDPWQWIDKAGQAAHQLNYKGVFLYQSGATVSSMQIMHMNYGPTGEFARVVQLDGSPREMLRQGDDVVLYQPRSEKVTIEKRKLQNSFPAVLPKVTEDIKTNYQARLMANERIGGREAQIVVLEPRDRFRYRCKLWIDRDSGLLLKMAFYGEKEEPVEQVGFNQLMLVEGETMDWFHPEVQRGKSYVIKPEERVAPSKTEAGDWVVGQVPPGFKKTDQVTRVIPGKSGPVNQLVFWDGLASVSLFIEAISQTGIPRVGSFSQGATNIQVSVSNGHQIVVLGEVPTITLNQFTNAVSFRK